MSFADNLMKGLGKFAEIAGQSSIVDEWKNILQKDGIQMLQVKIRNFLRSASDEDKNRMGRLIENILSCSTSSEDRRILSQVNEIYIDQRG